MTIIVVAISAVFAIAPTASAQDHRVHPTTDMPLHEKFYATWMMPDDPKQSCCNKADCYPTQARFANGQWWALRREDRKFIPVPWSKVERRRDNPDGRNHLCAPPPNTMIHAADTVFCFALGAGF